LLGSTAPLALSIMVLSALLATSAQYGMAWDEGYTIRRERLLDQWFARGADPARPGGWWPKLNQTDLDRYWRFSREEPNGHPPFYAILGLAAWRLSHRWLPPLEAYRFGPMLLTAATVGAIYHHLARRRGPLAGALAAVLVVAMPRPFAHAHYAHYDMPMTCFWLLAQTAFVASLDSRKCASAYGVALGLAAGTKFTGLFAVLPAVAWVVGFELVPGLHRARGVRQVTMKPKRPGLETLVIGVPLAILTLYAIQPPWWIEPESGPSRFLASNLSRSKTQPLPTLYLGSIYDFALPWHNTLVLTAVTTPVLVLMLGAVGIACCLVRRREQPCWMMIWPLSWATLMIIRALPCAPGHDGIRLFLPSVASLAVLAGLGVSWLVERLGTGRSLLIPLIAAAAMGECLTGIAQTYPYTDSYFNVAIGGLKGAERAGFELTYYWETAGREFLSWVGAKARERPVVVAFPMDSTNHSLIREWGEIPPGVRIIDLNSPATGKPVEPEYYVQQRRRGLWYPDDVWLDRFGHPLFVIRRQGVDLLRVYTHQESMEAAQHTREQPVRRALLRP
jgi:Dolichyl-phosphate-mannose-protein mannosyltransferase